MTDHSCIVVTVLLDPECEVQDTVLTCRMVYNWQASGMQLNSPPHLSVSLSWAGVPGTTVTTAADPATFSGTVETNMTIRPTSGTIPSCNCTIQFHFSPGFSSTYEYAVNSVSSTFVAEPTTVWRKFNIQEPCYCREDRVMPL